MLYIALLGITVSFAQQLPHSDIGAINERTSFFTWDQAITAPVSMLAGSLVSEKVTEWTDSRFLGVVSAMVVGGAGGYLKDRWDYKDNNAIPNHLKTYNDTTTAIVGSALGALTIRINLDGRRRSKHWASTPRWYKKRRR